MQNHTIIETNRLILRHYIPSDVEGMLKIFSDPVAMTYFPDTKTREETQEWIDWNMQSYKDNGFGLYAVELKVSGQFIGYCGFILQKDIDGVDEIEIGYSLIREFWHNGYATEAAISCKEYGFNNLNMDRLISLIRPENVPSRKVAERNGMHVEKSVMRWDFNHLVYVVGKEEKL